MTLACHRLIYVSAATDHFAKHDLDSILDAASRNNSARTITGLLLYHDGSFFQVLEGPAADVQEIFEIIRRDQRHAGVIVLESKVVAERAFPQWSMGYIGAHALRPDQRKWLVDLTTRLEGLDGEKLAQNDMVNLHIETFLSTFREFT